MSRAILITLALVLALSMCAEARPSRLQKKSVLGKGHNGGNGNESWDYLLLVQRWPGTECNVSRCNPGASKFNYWVLHGFWPQRNDGSWPQFCKGPQYTPSRISDLRPALEKYWPDLQRNDEDGFWAHEWNKHGTCAAQISQCATEHDYFSTVLKITQQDDLLAALMNNGIEAGRSYSVDVVSAAIKKTYGGVPVLGCSKHNLLHTISICYDKNVNIMDCPPSSEACTVSNVVIPFPPKPHF